MLTLWRITRRDHADLSGKGGLFTDGRWHNQGKYVTYTASSQALAQLEVLVHTDICNIPPNMVLMKIQTASNSIINAEESIPEIKKSPIEKLQGFGSQWYENRQSLLLKVPSVISSTDYNYIINCSHSELEHIQIIEIADFKFDDRLWN